MLASLALAAGLIANTAPTKAASAQENRPPECHEGTQPGGARFRICLPGEPWNGDLVLYAHGYVPPSSPLALPGEAGSFASPLLSKGYAFATTSYRVNGLAVLPAQGDLANLAEIFTTTYGKPRRTLLIGASEGGLITALAVEHRPDLYSGGLALCGPTSSFADQINYFGDVRVVFDALFPGMIPGDAAHIPPELRKGWSNLYQNRMLPLLQDPDSEEKLKTLIQVTGAAYSPGQPETLESTLRGALGYNLFATGDAIEKLGGQPFDNSNRTYHGSPDDVWLNNAVQRFTADSAAKAAMQPYETSGKLTVPLVAMHTTGDEIVPYFHLARYSEKATAAGSTALYAPMAVERYGHCSFTSEEILSGFDRLVEMVNAQPKSPTATPQVTAAPLPTHTAAAPAARAATPAAALPRQHVERGGIGNFFDRLSRFFSGLLKQFGTIRDSKQGLSPKPLV